MLHSVEHRIVTLKYFCHLKTKSQQQKLHQWFQHLIKCPLSLLVVQHVRREHLCAAQLTNCPSYI